MGRKALVDLRPRLKKRKIIGDGSSDPLDK